jgi:hypothetical protein
MATKKIRKMKNKSRKNKGGSGSIFKMFQTSKEKKIESSSPQTPIQPPIQPQLETQPPIQPQLETSPGKEKHNMKLFYTYDDKNCFVFSYEIEDFKNGDFKNGDFKIGVFSVILGNKNNDSNSHYMKCLEEFNNLVKIPELKPLLIEIKDVEQNIYREITNFPMFKIINDKLNFGNTILNKIGDCFTGKFLLKPTNLIYTYRP